MDRPRLRLVVVLAVLPVLASCIPLFGQRDDSPDEEAPDDTVTYTLTVTIEGEGMVTITPEKAVYSSGELITLEAVPNEDHFLAHWGGDAEGWLQNPLSLAIDGNRAVTAVFSPDLWSEAPGTAGWSARDRHAAASFDGQLWILGGMDNGDLNDVWSSSDGETWTQVSPVGETWSARAGHAAVVHDPAGGDAPDIWVIGGAYLRDAWRSSDGAVWTEVTEAAEWSPRTEFLALSHDGKLWVMGGYDGYGPLNDIWSSTDGVTWTPVTPTDGVWSPRRGHAGVVYDGKLWVIGGVGEDGPLSDVWYSEDGESWEQATADTGWPVRSGHAAAVHDGRIWVIGGHHYDGLQRYRDVWSSSDGVTWTAEPHGRWSPRSGHRALSRDNRLWIMGGVGEAMTKTNDVWYLETTEE